MLPLLLLALAMPRTMPGTMPPTMPPTMRPTSGAPCDLAVLQAALPRTAPATVRAGALFRVTMRWRAGTPVPDARVGGEPLHWQRAGDSLVALAAAPIDSTRTLALTLACADDTNGATHAVPLTVRAGTYRLEALRVAPRFAAPPDSALAARLEREAARAAAVSRAAHDTPRLWTDRFVTPRAARITSPFGGGRTFNGAVTSRHMGTDFAGATGAPVHAINRGVVRLVDRFHLGGNVVYVDHGEGLVSAYLHLSRTRVDVGDTVARGQRIGNVGATGRVTGPHLHLITRYGAVTVDPASVLGLGTSAAPSPRPEKKAAPPARRRSRPTR